MIRLVGKYVRKLGATALRWIKGNLLRTPRLLIQCRRQMDKLLQAAPWFGLFTLFRYNYSGTYFGMPDAQTEGFSRNMESLTSQEQRACLWLGPVIFSCCLSVSFPLDGRPDTITAGHGPERCSSDYD